MPNISKNYVNGDWITPSSAASMNVINRHSPSGLPLDFKIA
jgi:hypothetical protein